MRSLSLIIATLILISSGEVSATSPAEWAKIRSGKVPTVRNNLEKLKKDRDELAEKSGAVLGARLNELNDEITAALAACFDGQAAAQQTMTQPQMNACETALKTAQQSHKQAFSAAVNLNAMIEEVNNIAASKFRLKIQPGDLEQVNGLLNTAKETCTRQAGCDLILQQTRQAIDNLKQKIGMTAGAPAAKGAPSAAKGKVSSLGRPRAAGAPPPVQKK